MREIETAWGRHVRHPCAPARARARSDNIADPARETPISDATNPARLCRCTGCRGCTAHCENVGPTRIHLARGPSHGWVAGVVFSSGLRGASLTAEKGMAEDFMFLTFEHVSFVDRDDISFRCRVRGQIVRVGNLQWQAGTTVHVHGDRLVLRRADAAERRLIDWKPAA